MTRTTPELAPPLQTSSPHQWKGVWPATGPIHGGCSVEWGFEPATLRSQVRALPLGHRGLTEKLGHREWRASRELHEQAGSTTIIDANKKPFTQMKEKYSI
ncbi:hypothetical protein AVEN_209773-1 [Araneus ventricosus]|uniref:Uncharacterized protein n=1 Tax=Araneus ventricosus TaxID=182803 RepID=A0A4Y2CE46_ARAVE|nr:hypothetical protein AVEN_209773-1 [Araneus ventricosus]